MPFQSSGLCTMMSAATLNDTDAIRKSLASTAWRPYEVFFTHDRLVKGNIKKAGAILTNGWQERAHPAVRFTLPFDWQRGGIDHRSWRFHLHCWDMLGRVLAAYEFSREHRFIDFAANVALDWVTQHTQIEYDEGFAWYDMAIGVRAYRLAYILDVIARDDRFDTEMVRKLVASVQLHQTALADDRNFAAHSNHGFYLAAGQLAMARRLEMLPGMPMQFEQAKQRIHKLISTQFTAEGVHREHSPDYHRMVWETFEGLLRAGLLDREEFGPLSDTIQEALAWFVLPNGRIAMFGDTPGRNMIRDRSKFGDIENEALRFVMSGGQSGTPPPDQMRVFSESGYAVIRSGWSSGESDYENHSYLAQTACFHSRTHKHADDLSILWYDRGHEILVDAGRFGYLDRIDGSSELGRKGFYYGHPSRVYVESTCAHNTVEIDHESYPRVKVRPYGSAIRRTANDNGLFAIETEVRHHRTIRHERLLLFRPQQFLIVYDWLWDNAKNPHDYAQWFQFAPELNVRSKRTHLSVELPDRQQLFALPLLQGELHEPIRGREKPTLQGWISRQDNQLMSAWSVPVRQNDQPHAQYAMLFTFGNGLPEVRIANTNVSGRNGRFTWRQDGMKHDLRFDRPKDGDLNVTYQR